MELIAVSTGVLATVFVYLYERNHNRVWAWTCTAFVLIAFAGAGINYSMQHGVVQLLTGVVAVTLPSVGVILLVYWLGGREGGNGRQC